MEVKLDHKTQWAEVVEMIKAEKNVHKLIWEDAGLCYLSSPGGSRYEVTMNTPAEEVKKFIERCKNGM